MITKEQAEDFYKSLQKEIYGNTSSKEQAKISPYLISKKMKITEKTATDYVNAIVKYNISSMENIFLIV